MSEILSAVAESSYITKGRYQQSIGIKPRFYQGNGAWRRITNEIASTGAADMPIGLDELFQIRLDSRIAGKSPILYLGKGKSHTTLALLGANNGAGVVKGNTVTFPEAWDNCDLTYTVAGHRVQKDILLRKGHPSVFQFRLDTQVGFDPKTMSWGNDFRLLQPYLTRGGGDDVPLVWDIGMQGNKYILTVALPKGDWAGWTLDPTFSAQPDGAAGQDTSIIENISGDNYGGNSVLWVFSSAGSRRHILVRFDTGSIPGGASVSAATLSLFNSSNVPSNGTVYVARILSANSAWTELGATWDYAVASTTRWAGDSGGDGGADAGCSVSSTDYSADGLGSVAWAAWQAVGNQNDIVLDTAEITSMLGANHGIVVTGGNAYICSSDNATAAYRPELVVEYTEAASGNPWYYFAQQ